MKMAQDSKMAGLWAENSSQAIHVDTYLILLRESLIQVKSCGLAHATGVHERNNMPMHEIRVSVNSTVFVQAHRVKTKKAQIRHSLGTDQAQFWHGFRKV